MKMVIPKWHLNFGNQILGCPMILMKSSKNLDTPRFWWNPQIWNIIYKTPFWMVFRGCFWPLFGGKNTFLPYMPNMSHIRALAHAKGPGNDTIRGVILCPHTWGTKPPPFGCPNHTIWAPPIPPKSSIWHPNPGFWVILGVFRVLGVHLGVPEGVP